MNFGKYHHPAIMSYSKFEEVAELRAERSNVVREKDGSIVRKSTRYQE